MSSSIELELRELVAASAARDEARRRLRGARAALRAADREHGQRRAALRASEAAVRAAERPRWWQLPAALFRDTDAAMERAREQRAKDREATEASRARTQELRTEVEDLERAAQAAPPDLDARLDEALAAVERRVLAEGGPRAARLTDLVARSEELAAAETALESAWQLGRRARRAVGRARDDLRDASRVGMVDIAGGAVLTTWVKHDHLRSARRQIASARKALMAFRRGVGACSGRVPALDSGGVGGSLAIGDFLLDCGVVDVVVQTRIDKIAESVDRAARYVAREMRRLRDRRQEVTDARAALDRERAALLEPRSASAG